MSEDFGTYDATTKIIKNRPGQGRYCGNCGARVNGQCSIDVDKQVECLSGEERTHWRLKGGGEFINPATFHARTCRCDACVEYWERQQVEPDRVENPEFHTATGQDKMKFNRIQEGMPCDFCSRFVKREFSFCVSCDPENSNYDPYDFEVETCAPRRQFADETINHPSHYTAHPIEVIDIIKDQLLARYGIDGFRAYCWGNEIKYRMRAGLKGDAAEDIGKAMKYKEFREGCK